jgi:hypothetical protein
MTRSIAFLSKVCALLALTACSNTPPDPSRERRSALTADELACQLSDVANPGGYRAVWEAIPNDSANAALLWDTIIPDATTACRLRVRTMFWELAVPDNWAWLNTKLYPDWPWSGGGYFAQELWMHAIPYNRAWRSAQAPGWPWSAGGYYAQWFWMAAVPDNWAWRSKQPVDWPWSAGGYYAQWFWMSAVPASWAPDAGGWLSGPDAVHAREKAYLGYYEYWFWSQAVPNGWAVRSNIGDWYGGAQNGTPNDGYYKQWFWLHAVPDNWAPTAETRPSALEPVDGAPASYYRSTFYHHATVKGFAWQPPLGAGYYDHYWHDAPFLNAHPAVAPSYVALRDLGEKHTALATQAARDRGKVNQWFRPDAHAVVIFTFDEETWPQKGARLRTALRQELAPGQIKATFFVPWWEPWHWSWDLRQTPGAMDAWKQDIRDFDTANHATWHTALSRLFTSNQVAELSTELSNLQALGLPPIPGPYFQALNSPPQPGPRPRPFGAIRGPLCDGERSFDHGVLRNAFSHMDANGFTVLADSSFATIGPFARANGFTPPVGFGRTFMDNFPYPFVIATSQGKTIVEFPFQYPSDGALYVRFKDQVYFHGQKSSDPYSYAAEIWKRIFDETYDQHGVMVLLMHQHIQATVDCDPQIQDCDTLLWAGPNAHDPTSEHDPTSVRALIQYMRQKPGVYFSDIQEATNLFLAAP